MHRVRQPRQLVITLLHNAQRQQAQVHSDDASAHTLTFPLTGAAGSVAAVAGAEEQTDTRGVHDSLLHGEALLVVAAGDAEHVAFELGPDAVAEDFGAHASVHEDS